MRQTSGGSLLAEVKGQLRRFGLRARKGLGQHFLIDEGVVENVISAAELSSDDTVVEVGPGLGLLTRELARRAGQVFAIELDSRFASILKQSLAPSPRVEVIEADVLQVDLAGLVGERKGSSLSGGSPFPAYKVVANLPYYVASPILRHFLEAQLKPCLMVLMLQKEVGEAIVSGPGGMSLLSVSVQFYGKPTIISHVPAQSFYPQPKVDSVILRIDVYPGPVVEVGDVAGFFDMVRAGFSAPRKQLGNSLPQGLGLSVKEASRLLEGAGVDHHRRAETLSLDEWGRLWRMFACNKSEAPC